MNVRTLSQSFTISTTHAFWYNGNEQSQITKLIGLTYKKEFGEIDAIGREDFSRPFLIVQNERK